MAFHGIKPEVIIKTPSIVSKAFIGFKTGSHFNVITRQIGHLDFWNNKTGTVCIKYFWERPSELETRKYFDEFVVCIIQTHA